MAATMQSIIEKFRWYIGDGWQYALFLLALLYLLLAKEEKGNRRLFVGYSIVFGLIYFCPLTAYIIMKYCVGELVYWRMFWLLPIPLVIAYVGTRVWRCRKRKITQVCSLVILSVLLVVSGRSVYGRETPYQKATNLFKLAPEVCWVCDRLRANQQPGEELAVIAAGELVGYIRQYDAGIKLAYGRRPSGRREKWVAAEMQKAEPDFPLIAKYARLTKHPYLVYHVTAEQDSLIQSVGYQRLDEAGPYTIYRDSRQ